MTGVKICGLTAPGQVEAAARAGAAYVGFVFFARSPRNLAADHAAGLALQVPAGICKVALTVDADDAMLEALLAAVPLDMLQLHGRESPERVAQVRARFGLPVMKALGIASAEDVAGVARYEDAADMLLLDAKAPAGAALPGGNGLAFDWRLLAGKRFSRPWMLAGGLTPETVARAVTLTGAPNVDVSSGVESAPGVKDARKVADFVAAARTASGGEPAPCLR
ncbi:phosphoribosylanthranilate isomerase [Mangrovicoccus algicola]|uniref:N-(5'-phosphoribosyl)anthranilate isomerase n=1 Tax=Mangrovicoccus algicola TaxID=2771008 RepID=A0A8J7CKS4_9RHOB|nr:phosphoribosylanthranilate isomerase [Mangrovicoccus algicola]MBE3639196.1 phosphoribosylanthranilate isomerase [Mangrovicoccus algicola]